MKVKIKEMTLQKNDGTTECYVSNKDYRELEEKYNNLLNNLKKEFKVGEEVKWCGCFGYIHEIKDCKENGIRYMVAIPTPQRGTAFIFVMDNENALDLIGETDLRLE